MVLFDDLDRSVRQRTAALRGLLLHEVAELAEQRGDLLARLTRVARGYRIPPSPEALRLILEHGADQLLFRIEDAIERDLGGVRLGRDCVDAHTADSELVEEPPRGFEDPVARTTPRV